MSNGKPTLIILIAALAVVFLCIFPIEAQQRSRGSEDNSAKIAAALKEMLATSKQLVEFSAEAYQAGEIGVMELMTAQGQLLDLELKLAKAPAERIEILAQQLQLAKAAEKAAAVRYKAHEVPRSDVLQARISRLQIEVLILEETK